MSLFDETPALGKTWVLNAQWTDCPAEVKNEIREIWSYYGLGNDNYIWKASINDLAEGCDWKCPRAPNLIAYLKAHNIPEDEEVWLHYWW